MCFQQKPVGSLSELPTPTSSDAVLRYVPQGNNFNIGSEMAHSHEKYRHEQRFNGRSPCEQVKQQWQQQQKLEQQRYACPWHTQSGQSTTHGTGWHLPVSRARLAQPSFGSVAQSSTDRACRSASLAHSPAARACKPRVVSQGVCRPT